MNRYETHFEIERIKEELNELDSLECMVEGTIRDEVRNRKRALLTRAKDLENQMIRRLFNGSEGE